MRRYILTGTPGAGKTSVLRSLQARSYDVVEEAATAVIAEQHARGVSEPWAGPAFIDAIVARQRRRQQERVAGSLSTAVEIYDRSPVCTHALAVHMGYPISEALTAELDRIRREGIYERQVFFIRNIGFCEPTAARRISFEDSLKFERIHEESYRELGFELVEVPAVTVAQRADLIERAIAEFAAEGGNSVDGARDRWT